jgi:FlaA1/EpsC-like NDP-sugar epimerase
MYYKGKKILIIGGTGTIGQKLFHSLMKEEPNTIRIFSRDEFKQFEMENFIPQEYKVKTRFLIGDVRDYDRLERAMRGIDIVFNLAAMKHVPACEYNPDEAIKTNVNGMENVIKAAIENEVESVLFTSSDKAINPTNTYGATKMLAEKLVLAANYSKGHVKTKFIAVRFGNVMGSRGSVIPLFQKQILENKKITLTDPNMSRFMMTSSEACNLMMKACEISRGGELFVLKMPVLKLKDLAEIVVEETKKKFNISETISIDIIGLRAGERLYEELMTIEESHYAKELEEMYIVLPTSFSKEYYINLYRHLPNCKIGSYSSTNTVPISKEEIKQLFKEDLL